MKLKLVLTALCLLFLLPARAETAAANDDQLIARLLDIASQTDVFFWGESHGIVEQQALFQKFLLEAARRKTFDVIATEAVDDKFSEEYQKSFNPKIVDPSNPRSIDAFVDKIVIEGGGWVGNGGYHLHNIIREVKKIDPAVKVCGIDVFLGAATADDLQSDQHKLWRKFPKSIQQIFSSQKRLTKKQLFESEGALRDAGMAMATARCLKSSHHALVHVGAFHGPSPTLVEEFGPESRPFILSYILQKIFYPKKSFLTLRNAVENSGFKHYDVISQMVSRREIHGNTLMTRKEFMSQFSEEQNLAIKDYTTWDLMIVGPDGHDYVPRKN